MKSNHLFHFYNTKNELTRYNTASQNMRGFGGFLTFLIIFKLYNGGLERWAENPHVSNAETVSCNFWLEHGERNEYSEEIENFY